MVVLGLLKFVIGPYWRVHVYGQAVFAHLKEEKANFFIDLYFILGSTFRHSFDE